MKNFPKIICLHVVIYLWYQIIGLMGRMFANGPGDLGSIPSHVIPRLEKLYLIPPCLTLINIRFVSRVKWSNPEKGVAPSPTFRCFSYWKGSLLVALDYGRQLYFIYICSLLSQKQPEGSLLNSYYARIAPLLA